MDGIVCRLLGPWRPLRAMGRGIAAVGAGRAVMFYKPRSLPSTPSAATQDCRESNRETKLVLAAAALLALADFFRPSMLSKMPSAAALDASLLLSLAVADLNSLTQVPPTLDATAPRSPDSSSEPVLASSAMAFCTGTRLAVTSEVL